MIYADLGQLGLPADLQEQLRLATEALYALPDDEARRRYIENNSNLWREVRPYLARLTGKDEHDSKCWYCESKAPGFSHHVDHFRPKYRVTDSDGQHGPGYWWLAFEPTNYRLSCQRCNTGKGKRDRFPLAEHCDRVSQPDDNLDDEIPLLLDPTRAGDPILLAYSEDGRVYPRHEPNTFPALRAEVSIDVYNLNHVSKAEARKQVWLHCVELAKRAAGALNQLVASQPETSQAARDRFEDICRDIKRMVSFDAEYSSMARYCFRGTGEDWLLELI